MAEGRFILVYHEDMRTNHPSVWNDDKALATWLRLLALADKMWPSTAELPRGANMPAVERLVKAELIKRVDEYGYHIPSLDKRRSAASIAGRNAARIRHGSAEGNAKALRHPMPTNTRPLPDHISANGTVLEEEKPWILMTKEEQEAKRQRDQDETMKKAGWKVVQGD